MFTLLLAAALAPAADPATEKAVAAAVRILEDAAAASKDPADRARLRAAAVAAKAAGAGPTNNDLVSDFADNPGKYKGVLLVFRGVFSTPREDGTLRDRVGDSGVPFAATDARNGAKFSDGITIPRGLVVPAVRGGDGMVVAFVGDGTTRIVAKEIRRP